MGLEVATYVSDLNSAWPLGSDSKSTADDHIRLIKAVLQATFPNAAAPAKGTFTGTFTGCTVAVTATIQYTISNGIACLRIPSTTGTSNAATFTVTGLPAALTPSAENMFPIAYMLDAGGVMTGGAGSISGTTLTLYKGNSANGWTSSGAKGFGAAVGGGGQSFCYSLN